MARQYNRRDRKINLDISDFLSHSARLASMVVMLDTSAPLYVKVGGQPAAYIDRRGENFRMIPFTSRGFALCESLCTLIGERAEIPALMRTKLLGPYSS